MRDPHSAEEWERPADYGTTAYLEREAAAMRVRVDRDMRIMLGTPPAPSRLWRGVAWGLGIVAFCAIWWFVLRTAN